MPRSLLFHSLAAIATLFFALSARPLLAMEPDETLLLLEGGDRGSVTASRAPKPLSQSAENITIVTSREIDSLHAHTLEEVLLGVSGVQIQSVRTPGSFSYMRLQGSGPSHVLVMLDGVPLNSLGENLADISLIPARIIDRVEIVKGAASSSWGQALGGVINVITKSADDRERLAGGSVSATLGEGRTVDSGGELMGGSGSFGYYLSGGRLSSDGLLANNHTRLKSAYAKLSYDLPTSGELTATLAELSGKRGDFAYPTLGIQEDSSPRISLATLSLRQPLTERLEFGISGRFAEKNYGMKLSTIPNNTLFRGIGVEESATGLSASLIWRGTSNLLVSGVEYDHVHLRQSDAINQADFLNRDAVRWGFYLNDTLSLGRVAVSPGVRYDLTGNGGEQFSPSLGVTWQLSENSLLRAYTAKGYSLPSLLLNQGAEKVWTTQVGIESSAVPSLWLKGTLFRNETWDIIEWDSPVSYHHERQIKQGGELELRTAPWHGTSFSSGYSYTDARRSGDHEVVRNVPSHTLQLGVRYDDFRYLQALLNGRYLWWNAEPRQMGHYSPMVWDLHLSAYPSGRRDSGAELFFSVRNLFNGSLYMSEPFQNARRWAEFGLKVRF